MFVTKRDNTRQKLDLAHIHRAVENAVGDISGVSQSELEIDSHLQFYDGIKTKDIQTILVKTAADKISAEYPNWTYVAARLMIAGIYKETGNTSYSSYVRRAVSQSILDPRLASDFDLSRLDQAVVDGAVNDNLFQYHGIQILQDRYLIRDTNGKLMETPQLFFMRVACGIALAEEASARTEWAIKFYNLLSSLKFLNSTPTLFNAGTLHPQLSSCFLLSMEDSLEGILGTCTEAATYSKYSGGLGVDISNIRGSGSLIKSTRGTSSGVVPYVRLLQDIAVGFNQGGKRNGSVAPYLELHHPDLEQFLDLKNTSGDELLRAHHVFPALWVRDLFMERVENNGVWSFFSSDVAPDLHSLYGDAYTKRYLQLEADGLFHHQMPAMNLWKLIVQRIYETGTYWINFADEANRRYAQVKTGPVLSSNLCTEILLRSDESTSAVCNLGSINLARVEDYDDLRNTVSLGVRMLDNVVEIGIIPHPNGRSFQEQDRAVGLGVFGYAEYLYIRGIRFDSEEHLRAADELFEQISYSAILTSAELARERGSYPTFPESTWAEGMVPLDTAREQSSTLNWDYLRSIVAGGMRNSCLMAIAPTSTISDIAGTTASVELPLKNYYIRENMSGNFQITSPLLKYSGNPETMMDVDMGIVIEAAAVRQKWIDQSQSLNLRVRDMPGVGKYISDLYFKAWKSGVKTTYYVKGMSREAQVVSQLEPGVEMCSIDNPECQSCQ